VNGADQLAALKAGGFSDAELQSYQADHTAALLNGGFSQEEVANYWGQKPFNSTPVKDYFKKNLGTVKGEPGKELGFGDYLDAGWQMSVTGLIKRQKLPDTLAPEDAPMWGRIASQVGQIAGDLPAMLGGAFLGQQGGAAVGTIAGAPVGPEGAAAGGAAGATLGAGYGAFALPAYLRRVMVDAYKKGSIKDAQDFWERTSSAFLEAHNSGVVGGITAGAGGLVGAAATPIMSPIAAQTAKIAAEVTSMVTAGKAMQGQLPSATDFAEAAILVGGLHLATGGAGQLKRLTGKVGDTYADTGIRPQEVVQDAQTDPTVKQDIASDNIDIPKRYEGQIDPTVKPEAPKPVDVPKDMRSQSMAVEGSVANDVAIKSEEVPRETPIDASKSDALPVEPTREKTAQQQVLDRIGVEEPTGVKPTLDKVYTALVDDLHPIKQLTRLLNGEKPLEVPDDPYQLARLTRGSTGKADHFLEYSPFDFKTFENVGKPLSKILEPIKDDLDGLRAYAVSKRALELESRGIKTGVPLEAAQEVVNAGGRFEQSFADLKDYQTHTLEYLRDSGILSQDAFEKMQEANQDYVPFYRLMDEGSEGPKGVGKGLSVRAPIKKIEGSTRMIVDPLESIIRNTYTYVQLAERNRALSTLADMADAAGEKASDLMVRVASASRKDTGVNAFMKENGVEADPETLQVFRPRAPGLRNDEIALYRDGERQVFQVSPEVATAVRALDQQSVGLAVKIMRAPARWLRAGTTLSPEFTARNFIRDQLTAFNLGEKGIIPIFDALRGLGSLFRKDEDYQNFLKSGGANSALVALDRDYIEQNIFKLEKDTGLMSKTWNVLKSPLEILRATSEIVENATRLGEYKRVTSGESDAQTIMGGGMSAREVTLDFQRVGAQTRALNMIVAFWNAHVQGLDKTARAFIDRPAATAFKLGLSVTLPSVLLWYANNEDPRWAEIPRWQKDLFWIFMTKDHIYRIPKPMELGILFGSLPERALEAYKGTNPKAFQDLGSSLMQALTPSYVPTFAIPVIEQFANRSTFTGNPIVPAAMEGILPEYQYTDYTSESGKLLGKFAATMPGFKDTSMSSPVVIENYVRAWSGQLGQYALKLADQALISTGTIPDPVKPAATLADIPVIKAFVIRYPSASAQSITDFYDAYDKTNTRLNTIKYLAKSGEIQSAMDLMKVAQSENDLFRLQGIKDALSTQTKYLRLVAKNPEITPTEKRQLIDGVYLMMINAARQGNQIMDSMNAQLKARGVSMGMPPPLNPSQPAVRLQQ
jgi:Large polyvalent protein associated domain 38